jgi:hypothetical protein
MMVIHTNYKGIFVPLFGEALGIAILALNPCTPQRGNPMRQSSHLCSFLLCSCAISVFAGCNSLPGSTSGLVSSPPVVTPPVSPPPAPRVTAPSIYVTQYDWEPWSVMIFPITESGWAEPTVEIPGIQVSVDGAGNIYVVAVNNNNSSYKVTSINVYSPDSPTGNPVRSLPIGSGTKIPEFHGMVANTTGEIFVNDGNGIAVFGPAATGDADPVRYILGNTQPGGGVDTAIKPDVMAVDSSDNLYVGTTSYTTYPLVLSTFIYVFGAKDTGTVVPSRTIAGPATQSALIESMATDNVGNLYVLCYADRADGLNSFGVYEFGPTANGNVAPMRYVTTPGMNTEYEGTGVAVDSAGTIYVMASRVLSQGAVFEFPSTASGSFSPAKTLTYSTWWESMGTMDVH